MFTSGLVYLQILPVLTSTFRIEIEELTYLKTKITQHRFKFIAYELHFMNPSVFVLEITNSKADTNTDLKSFTKDAEVTFVSKSWVMI